MTDANSPFTHVRFDTSVGSFVVELYHKHAPRTCYNMAALAYKGYYNGTPIHRIVRDFMCQMGDPTGTGRGGESIYGGKFEDEISRNLKHTGAGIVSMANAGVSANHLSSTKVVYRGASLIINFLCFDNSPTRMDHSSLSRSNRHRFWMVSTQYSEEFIVAWALFSAWAWWRRTGTIGRSNQL